MRCAGFGGHVVLPNLRVSAGPWRCHEPPGRNSKSACIEERVLEIDEAAAGYRAISGAASRRRSPAPNARKAYWGIVVTDATTGQTLYELNADGLFTPASNAKIFTSAFAFATLGSDYTFRTTIETQGSSMQTAGCMAISRLVGRGDPDLSNRRLPFVQKVERDGPADKIIAELADAVVARGVKRIDGDIIGDDSYFAYDPYPEGWTTGDLYFSFGAPISAIALNDNVITSIFGPASISTILRRSPSSQRRATKPLAMRSPPGRARRRLNFRWYASRRETGSCCAARSLSAALP